MARTAMRALLTLDQIQRLLDLNRETGELRWTAQASLGRLTHRIAGSTSNNGYTQIKIGKRVYQAHRIVWLLTYGEWPSADIDHADGDRQNNAPHNLRLATPSQNAQNRGRVIRSTGFSAGSTGWRIDGSGNAEFNVVSVGPYLSAKASLHPFSNRAAA